MPDLASVVAELTIHQRRRTLLIRTVNRIVLAAKTHAKRSRGYHAGMPEADRDALGKWAGKVWQAVAKGDPVADLHPAVYGDIALLRASLAPLEAQREIVEKEMVAIAKLLPGTDFVSNVRGLGWLGFAILAAEAGDIGSYPDKHRLWKRLGLAPYRGHAMSSWKGGVKDHTFDPEDPDIIKLTADEWSAAGYAPHRRAEIYAVIGESLMRGQRDGDPYREVYEARREKTAETHPDWTKGHSHNDAMRVMTKALVRDIRLRWREDAVTMQEIEMPAAAVPRVAPELRVVGGAADGTGQARGTRFDGPAKGHPRPSAAIRNGAPVEVNGMKFDNRSAALKALGLHTNQTNTVMRRLGLDWHGAVMHQIARREAKAS